MEKRKTQNETSDTSIFSFPDELIQSINSLNEICSQQEDTAAAMLYRLMFRHEKNINLLDRFADQILDNMTGFGGKYAEEDYRNYLQYLMAILPSEVQEHKVLFENLVKEFSDDDIEEEEKEEEER